MNAAIQATLQERMSRELQAEQAGSPKSMFSVSMYSQFKAD